MGGKIEKLQQVSKLSVRVYCRNARSYVPVCVCMYMDIISKEQPIAVSEPCQYIRARYMYLQLPSNFQFWVLTIVSTCVTIKSRF